jgi:dTDP-4-amino-4,6-dideoxygalactose transaminase
MIPAFDLSRQYAAIRPELDAAIGGVLSKGSFILGENVQAFEREFAAYVGVDHAVGVGSGTEALHLALLALGIGAGDEVITVPHTAVATVAAIELAGARPVLVDIEPRTMTMDPALVEAKITVRTRAILPVHLYGHPAALDPLLAIARRRGLHLIEDCAQAHGAEYQGRRVGALGHVGCFSFYPTKNLGAYGDGGAVVTNDGQIARRLRSLREYGWEERYVSAIGGGMNTRLDEMQAAILRVKLCHLDEWTQARRALAAAYAHALAGADVTIPVETADARHVYHLYVIRARQRDALRQYLKDNGVGTGIHYPVPVHLQPGYARLGSGLGTFPESERAAADILSLPMFPELTAAEAETVALHVGRFGAEDNGRR